MPQSSGMAAWGASLARNTPACGARGAAIPVDLYAHNPSEVQAYKSWTGCIFSVVVFIVVGFSCGYVVFEYMTLPFDLAQSQIVHDPELEVAPAAVPAMPDIGVQFALSNGTFFNIENHPEILDILFFQNVILGDGQGGTCPGKFEGERCRKRTRIPSERCRFFGGEGVQQLFDAFCPMWGYFEETLDEFGVLDVDFHATKDRENASIPAMQGVFLDPVYQFVDVEVHVNLTGLSIHGADLELELKDFYGGTVAYIAAYHRWHLADIGINDGVFEKFERWSQSVEVKEFLTSKVDIPWVVRTIEKGNFIVDFAALEGEFQDVVVGEVVQELDDAPHIPSLYVLQNTTGNLPVRFDSELQEFVNASVPETITVSKGFYRSSDTAFQIKMTPPSTIFDILGIVGGFLSLFSLMIGWPAMIINQFYYSRALSKAKAEGMIPAEYLEEDGTVRVERANEVIHRLNEMSRTRKQRTTAEHDYDSENKQ